jgi:hypothetical protein
MNITYDQLTDALKKYAEHLANYSNHMFKHGMSYEGKQANEQLQNARRVLVDLGALDRSAL